MSDLPEPQPPAAMPPDAADPIGGAARGTAQSEQQRLPAVEDGPEPPLAARLEAVLLVADQPVTAGALAHVVERSTGEVEAVLRGLAQQYDQESRGFQLLAVAGGWRLYTRDACAPWVERFVLDGQQARLTQAALETLAIIAYRQPITRARVGAVRGVNPDAVVRTLLSRGLVAEVGQDGENGATLLATTPLLLEKLGLSSLAELPSLSPLLPEIDEVMSGSRST